MIHLGFLAEADSRKRREYLGETLRIGYSNRKQLIERIELLGIVLAEIEEAKKSYENYSNNVENYVKMKVTRSLYEK